MNIFIISVYCFAFSSFLLGFIIYLKRQDSLGRKWFLFSILCTLWALGYSFQINNTIDYYFALWASRLADAVALFIPIAWISIVYEFFEIKMPKKLFAGILCFSILIFFTFPTSLFIPFLKDKSHLGISHFVHGAITFHLFTFLFVCLVFWGFYLTLKSSLDRRLTIEKRRQALLLFISASFGFGGGSLAFLPVYDIDVPVLWGTLFLPFFPFLMALATTKYRLLDIEELAKAAHRDKLAAIGTLATSINHEIRNPLYVIQGLAESHLTNLEDGIYATKDEVLEKSSEILKKTAEQATRAMEIMRNFAMFAKKEIRQEAQTESVNLNETLEGILPLISHEMELDKIEFVRNIPAELSPLKADHRHLEEILFNLIVNACQAMKIQEQRGKIEISAAQHNGAVHIKVEDNGPGISPKQLSQIFEPFYTTKSEGTGLGLYVTKQLIEKNGGRISVKSKLGRGTQFHLEFKQ